MLRLQFLIPARLDALHVCRGTLEHAVGIRISLYMHLEAGLHKGIIEIVA